MRATHVKMIGLAVLLIAGTGATWPDMCFGPCGPEYARIDLPDADPLSGTVVSEDEVTITFSGTEEVTVYVQTHNYEVFGNLAKWDGAHWTWVQGLHWWPSEWGPWEQSGNCSEIRDVDATFPNVPLTEGENRFRCELHVSWSDGDSFWVYSDEAVYTYQP